MLNILTPVRDRFGIWGLCYVLQPVQRGLLVARLAKPGAFEAAMVSLSSFDTDINPWYAPECLNHSLRPTAG
jgi:hypothetical protein